MPLLLAPVLWLLSGGAVGENAQVEVRFAASRWEDFAGATAHVARLRHLELFRPQAVIGGGGVALQLEHRGEDVFQRPRELPVELWDLGAGRLESFLSNPALRRPVHAVGGNRLERGHVFLARDTHGFWTLFELTLRDAAVAGGVQLAERVRVSRR